MRENKLRKITREFSINLKKFDTIGNREFNSAEEIFVQAEKQIKDLMLSKEEIGEVIIDKFDAHDLECEDCDICAVGINIIAKAIIKARDKKMEAEMSEKNQEREVTEQESKDIKFLVPLLANECDEIMNTRVAKIRKYFYNKIKSLMLSKKELIEIISGSFSSRIEEIVKEIIQTREEKMNNG